MQHHYHLPAGLSAPGGPGRPRRGGAHQGLLAAVMALALGAWVVVVQHGGPEVDASIAQQTLVVLDEMLAAGSGGDR